jgi:hypothetical protein
MKKPPSWGPGGLVFFVIASACWRVQQAAGGYASGVTCDAASLVVLRR